MLDKRTFTPENILDYESAREQAFTYYEQSLLTSKPDYLQAYLEKLLGQDPIPLELLHDIAQSLQDQLVELYGTYGDIRNRLVKALTNIYEIDGPAVISPEQFDQFHTLDRDYFLNYLEAQGHELSRAEIAMLDDMISSSILSCQKIQQDILLTGYISALLHDWLIAYLVTDFRQNRDWGGPKITHTFSLWQ